MSAHIFPAMMEYQNETDQRSSILSKPPTLVVLGTELKRS
jgi:hypothetical protein